MAHPLDFSGKVAVVTGGCRGIGRAIAIRFLEAGADVVVCCRHEPEALPSADGRKAVFVAADVRDADECQRVVDVAVERFDRLDVVVNNAGGAPPADAASASPRFSEAVVRLNLLGALFMAQRANTVMQAQADGGAIVNIGSVSGLRPSPGAAAYGAAKAGLINLTQTLAMEWAPTVRVNCVTPGLVLTEDAEAHYGDEASQRAVAATVPVGRMADPTEIADACLFLASGLSGFTTGANLVLHGGGERPPYLDVVDR
ncbi:MAG: SDR family oxidoreductase [Acidimicrobiia bacterium]|nr:SDR family oxidoreductase [Acidimicrobiia bacterium]